MSVKPEDILPDNVDTVEINGITARKGSIAAALANAKILALPTAAASEKAQAKSMLKELAPILVALELHEHLVWKNPEIQQIIDQAIKQSSNQAK